MAFDRLWIAAKLTSFAAGAALLLFGAPAIVPALESAPAPAPRQAQAAPAEAAVRQLAAATTGRPMTLGDVEVRRELNIPHWLRPGEYVWDDEGAPASGPTIVVVNIRARVLSVYRAGIEIGRSSLIYGADNKPTPHGTFPVLEKDADHISNLYDAPMPHMLRLTWDGVAIHGSANMADDAATRGCVGLPEEFAALLFDVVGVGDQVIVWDGTNASRT